MLFSIVIPAYNAKLIDLPLLSIANQLFKDFEVIVVDDCSTDKSYYKIVEKFKEYMNIRIVERDKNGGCGPTLQTGLDNCQGEYFIPIDADDTFASCDNLLTLAKVIQENNSPDIISTQFMQYNPENYQMSLMQSNNLAFVHGKLFRVEFCRDNDLRFPDTKWYEDGAFNQVAFDMTQRKVFLQYTTYMWMANTESITRSRDYNVEVMEYYFASFVRSYNIFKGRDKRIANLKMIGLLSMGFYYYNAFVKRNVDKKKLKDILTFYGNALNETGIIDSINNDRGLFDQLTITDSNSKMSIESQEGQFILTTTLNDFLKKNFGKSISWLEN